DTAGTNHRTLTDGYTRHYQYATTQPAIVFDSDGCNHFQPARTFPRIQGMGGGVELNARPEQYAIPNNNGRCIQHYAVMVCVKIIAEKNIATVIANKVRFNIGLVGAAKQRLVNRLPRLALISAQPIELLAKHLGFFARCHQVWLKRIDGGKFVHLPAPK